MKNIKRFLLLVVCFILAIGCVPVEAGIPYATYTYDIDGQYMESPSAYVPYQVIDQEYLGVKLEDPSDFCADIDGNIYISDVKGGSVVILDKNFKVITTVKDFVNEWGVRDTITAPSAVFVTPAQNVTYEENDPALDSKTLYVCDSTQNRILVFDVTDFENIRFELTMYQPESDVFAEGHVFKPIAVAVDKVGRIYTVGEYSYQGIISMNSDGSFFGFLGAQTQKTSIIDIIWRAFQTEEQRRKSIKTVSTEYNNLNIDEDGFVYATTSSISAGDQQNAITAKDKSGTYAPVKKLSPDGTDVMKRTGFYPPSGEVTVTSVAADDKTITGPSKVTDVALGPNGIWSIIDEKRSRVFTYDEEGRLLFAFGDMGNQLGNIQALAALEYHTVYEKDEDGNYVLDENGERKYNSNLLLLDSTNKNITVYKRTSYGDLLDKAIKANRDRKYQLAESMWQEILQRNSNFDMSYVGIGKNLYRAAAAMSDNDPGKIATYKEAMSYYEYAYDTANWSDCYKEVRKLYVKKYVILIPIIIIVLCIAISKWFKLTGKVNEKEMLDLKKKRSLWSEYCYGYHVMFHPFDGFYDIKHEYRASIKGALLILAFTIIAFIYQAVGRGYVFTAVPQDVSIIMTIFSILLPVVLWAVANWCLTTLFDGEGSLRDIFIATCYSLFPLPAIIIIATFASNYVTNAEMGMINLLIGVGYFWVGFLLFFGMQTIHDYSLLKNCLTTIASIVGMAFIMFIGILFSSLLAKIFSFIYNIILELSYRV